MQKNILMLGIIGIALLAACNKQRVVEKFSPEKPYAIQIARERSFYQAEKLTNRLLDMELDAYVIQYADSAEDDGTWFYILCDNIAFLDSAKSIRTRLEQNMALEDLKIVTYNDFKNATFNLDSVKQNERKQITANKPAIKSEIYDVISKFPESNALYVQKTFILSTPADSSDLTGYSHIYGFEMDLPRGISKKMILKRTLAFSEVLYKDNLYGDRVTIDIGKLRNNKGFVQAASMINVKNKASFEIAEEYADLILETGEYLFEEKKEVEMDAFLKLFGYKVTIEPKKDYFRTYLVLVDEAAQYIVFCQSTEKTDEELTAILGGLGKGEGLKSYDEFYNSFYTLPDKIISNDHFICFTVDKLAWSYAKSRNYAKWAKEMVGHWNASGYYYNPDKGVWAYNVFDLLTSSNQNYIYGDLYAGNKSSNHIKQVVHNTEGIVVYEEKINWDTWKRYKKASEINFGIDRFVTAVANTEHSWFTKDELVERAETLQIEDTHATNKTTE